MKHFNPNHYGFPSIKQAQKAMARIADHINQVKKQEENARRVEHLQTSLYGWKGNEVCGVVCGWNGNEVYGWKGKEVHVCGVVCGWNGNEVYGRGMRYLV